MHYKKKAYLVTDKKGNFLHPKGDAYFLSKKMIGAAVWKGKKNVERFIKNTGETDLKPFELKSNNGKK